MTIALIAAYWIVGVVVCVKHWLSFKEEMRLSTVLLALVLVAWEWPFLASDLVTIKIPNPVIFRRKK